MVNNTGYITVHGLNEGHIVHYTDIEFHMEKSQQIYYYKHCGLVTPYSNNNIARFGSTLVVVMACCLPAPSHYLNLFNVDLSSKVFCGIHLGAISQEELMDLIHNFLNYYRISQGPMS